MKIQIVSDLHIDINKDSNFDFINYINDCDLTLIAGDIAGGYKEEEKFLDRLVKIAEKPVLCVGGNHLGYNYQYGSGVIGTKIWSLNYLTQKYNSGNVKYLDNMMFAVNDEYIVFGGTMYTDFNLYNDVETSGKLAERGLNDFVYVYIFDGEKIRRVRYTDYIKWFNEFKNKLEYCLQHYPDKKFIVLTHFATSAKSLDEKYVFNQLNPAYASDLDGFIEQYPQIKLWTHGHIHSSLDYMVGECRVVCEPYGYAGYDGDLCARKYFGKVVEI